MYIFPKPQLPTSSHASVCFSCSTFGLVLWHHSVIPCLIRMHAQRGVRNAGCLNRSTMRISVTFSHIKMSKQRLRKIGHMAGQWVLITDERDDVEAQSVICCEEADGFPHDRIKSQWGFGRRITQVRSEPVAVFGHLPGRNFLSILFIPFHLPY